jgi:hypothetical protein
MTIRTLWEPTPIHFSFQEAQQWPLLLWFLSLSFLLDARGEHSRSWEMVCVLSNYFLCFSLSFTSFMLAQFCLLILTIFRIQSIYFSFIAKDRFIFSTLISHRASETLRAVWGFSYIQFFAPKEWDKILFLISFALNAFSPLSDFQEGFFCLTLSSLLISISLNIVKTNSRYVATFPASSFIS